MWSALIIDADPRVAIRLSTILADRPMTAGILADPAQAVARARSTAPALIFLRVELPGVSGFTVCNKLRRDEDTRAIPLILYSSETSAELFDAHSKLKTRASAYLHVPLEAARVHAAITACLGASR